MRYVLVGAISALFGTGCASDRSVIPGDSTTSANAITRNAPESGRKSNDPCDLITSEEIEALQGGAVVGTKSSRRAGGGLAFNQCFFSLAEFSKSVHLEVVQNDPDHPSPVDPVRHWKELFHRDWDPTRKKGVPIKVDGVGDEAFWTGDARIGALYVLQGQSYIRLSVGGQSERSEKMDSAKILALKALNRL